MDQALIGAALLEQGRPRFGLVARWPLRPVWRRHSRLLRSRPPCAASTSISTARCSVRAVRCCAGPTGGSRLTGCGRSRRADRAGVEVVLYSGRRQSSVFEDCQADRLELLHLRARVRPGRRRRARVVDRRRRRRRPRRGRSTTRSSDRARPRCCSSASRGGSSTTRRGRSGATSRICSAGRSTGRGARGARRCRLRLAAARRQRRRPRGDRADGRDCRSIHAYHLIPAGASKARAVARHMQARGYARADCIAVGDSREDMDAATVVGAFWLVANALERDPDLAAEVSRATWRSDRFRALRRRRLRGGRDYAGD